MVSRRRAREGALQVLFQVEMGHALLNEAVEHTIAEMDLTHEMAEYMERVARGVYTNRRQIDPFVERFLRDYEMDRLAAVDRNVLRIATYELLHVPEMPPKVTINEAIEIARKFSTAESGRFVNGVLGQLLLDTPKRDWDPATAPPEVWESCSEPEVEIEETVVDADSPEGREAQRFGWVVRADSGE